MTLKLKVTILGCGSSTGVPRIGNDWGVCDPTNPKNRRRRCSILVERGATAILVDPSPDLREQLLATGTKRLDACLITHEHADQAHGIDDLRTIAYLMRKRVDTYSDARCIEVLERRFDYCFKTPAGSSYPPILKAHIIEMGQVLTFGEGADQIEVTAFEQDHGDVVSLGYRFGDFAYSSDVVRLNEQAFEALAGVRTWVVDALRINPHPSHSHVAQTLGWIEKLGVSHGILTNMHIDLDYAALSAQLPAGVEPAYDGMVIEV
jgi:phosphoribosyl 1,2-cyclic phosphate phosphodiesterase